MRLGAPRGEGARHPKQDELPLLGQLGQVHLLVGGALEQIHGGDGVAGLREREKIVDVSRDIMTATPN